MYNRYIPQDDGTYRKNQMPESAPAARPQQAPPRRPQQPAHEPEKQHFEEKPQPCEESESVCRQNMNAGSFLRQLLPKNIDTGDLMIILLLLLMSGDCAEDKNTALLTLALYLFM